MKKHLKSIVCRALALSLALSFALGSAGCAAGKKTSSSSAAKAAVSITDDNGNVVKLPKKIDRIVVCDILPLPSVLVVFFDSAKKIVGMSEPSMTAAKNSLLSELYPDILKANTGFIKDSDVNIEELAKLNPDVVFYSANSKELGDKLTKAGFCAIAVSPSKWGYNSIDTLDNWISMLSKMFPENDKAKKVKDYSSKTYQMVQKRVSGLSDSEKARVFFLFKYSQSAIMTSGSSFFGQWWADAIGAVNVGKDISKDNAVPVNMEQIYKWNPGIVFITNFTTAQPKDIYNNSVGSFNWSGIDAVKNKQVYKMPLGMYRSYTPGVDTPVTLMWLAKTVYPKLFSDIDITSETKKYYKSVFGVTLTDKQANSIFAPASDAAKGF
jgi:iron complex transport system substrate-binding protein